MINKPHIQIIGMPSTTYTYVKYIMEQVLERTGISIDINEVTDIKKIIEYKISVIPTLKINDQEFPFHASENTNDLLKKAILYLLKEVEFARWPVFILCTEKVGDAFYLASNWAKKDNGIIEWVLQKQSTPVIPKREFDQNNRIAQIIKGAGHDWMSQIFNSPLINHHFTNQDPKSECLELSANRNTKGIIIDFEAKINWTLIINWLEKSKIPLIITRGTDHSSPIQKISIIGDTEFSRSSELLTQLLNKKRNSISYFSTHSVPTGKYFEHEELHSDPTNEHFLTELSFAPKPDLWAVQFSNRKRFKDFLKTRPIRQWMNKVKEPMIFLPTKKAKLYQ